MRSHNKQYEYNDNSVGAGVELPFTATAVGQLDEIVLRQCAHCVLTQLTPTPRVYVEYDHGVDTQVTGWHQRVGDKNKLNRGQFYIHI